MVTPPRPPDFVLDVRVSLAWIVSTQGTPYTSGVLQRMPTAVAATPASWPLELAQAVLLAERRGSLTPVQSAQKLATVAGFNIRIDDRPHAGLWPDVMAVARSRRMPVFDAAYLELAVRLKLPLATINATLTRAAAAAGVPVFTS